MGTVPEVVGLQVRLVCLRMSRSDLGTTVPVSVAYFLGDCRDDNPRRDYFPLYPSLAQSLLSHRVLCGAGGECNLWRERSHRGLPHLLANNVQVGTKYG